MTKIAVLSFMFVTSSPFRGKQYLKLIVGAQHEGFKSSVSYRLEDVTNIFANNMIDQG
jgi:hypothetical protein